MSIDRYVDTAEVRRRFPQASRAASRRRPYTTGPNPTYPTASLADRNLMDYPADTHWPTRHWLLARAIDVARKQVANGDLPGILARFIIETWQLAPVDVVSSTQLLGQLIKCDYPSPERCAQLLIEEGAYQMGG